MSFAPPNRRLYVGRVHPDASRADLEDLFGSTGIRPADVKLLSGFGFVEYDSIADAEDAIRDFDAKDFMGDRLLVQFAKSSGERRPPPRGYDDRPPPRTFERGAKPSQGWRLTISNLPNGCSWQDLKDFARTAGAVHYAEVSRSDPSEGVIEYMSFSDADGAIKSLDGVDLRGNIVRVVEGAPAPGQSWSDPRPSPPRRDSMRDDDRRGGGGYGRRDRSRSRSPGFRRDRDDRGDRRGGGGGRDYDDRDRRSYSRRERTRSPVGGRDDRDREPRRSPRYDRDDRRSPRYDRD